MALDAATVAFGDLVFGERSQEPGGGPTFLVRSLGKCRPALLDRGQPMATSSAIALFQKFLDLVADGIDMVDGVVVATIPWKFMILDRLSQFLKVISRLL